jgi:hypothetical protein
MCLEDRIKVARMIAEGRVSLNKAGKVWNILKEEKGFSKRAGRRYLLEALAFLIADLADRLVCSRHIYIKSDATSFVIQRNLFALRFGGVIFELKPSPIELHRTCSSPTTQLSQA